MIEPPIDGVEGLGVEGTGGTENATIPAWASAFMRRTQEEEKRAREKAVSKLTAFINEAVSSLNARIDVILSEQPSHANEAHGEKPKFDFSEKLEKAASRGVLDLTDYIAEALRGMNSQVQRSTRSLNVLDRYLQQRIRCFEEDQGQIQALVAELQSEVQMRSKLTDDAVADLRDKLAKVLCNSEMKSATPPGSHGSQSSQQRGAALPRAASPCATPPRIRHLSAGQNLRPGTALQFQPQGTHSSQSGGDASIQRSSAEAAHISAPAATMLAPQPSRGMLHMDAAEMVAQPPEIAAKARVASPWHRAALSGSQPNPRLAHNLQQRQQQSLQHMQANGVVRQSSARGTFLV